MPFWIILLLIFVVTMVLLAMQIRDQQQGGASFAFTAIESFSTVVNPSGLCPSFMMIGEDHTVDGHNSVQFVFDLAKQPGVDFVSLYNEYRGSVTHKVQSSMKTVDEQLHNHPAIHHKQCDPRGDLVWRDNVRLRQEPTPTYTAAIKKWMRRVAEGTNLYSVENHRRMFDQLYHPDHVGSPLHGLHPKVLNSTIFQTIFDRSRTRNFETCSRHELEPFRWLSSIMVPSVEIKFLGDLLFYDPKPNEIILFMLGDYHARSIRHVLADMSTIAIWKPGETIPDYEVLVKQMTHQKSAVLTPAANDVVADFWGTYDPSIQPP